jgi:hypothetical protein
LESEADSVLEKLETLVHAQLQAFREKKEDEFMRLDKELENTVGLKERTIGALRQHVKDHRCQSESL